VNLIKIIKDYIKSENKTYEPLSGFLGFIGTIIVIFLIIAYMPFSVLKGALIIFLIMFSLACLYSGFEDLKTKREKKRKGQ
jgi:uncharacterized membrane protein